MTTTLALATRLRALPDAELVASLHDRTYRRAGIADLFDLADALLDTDSVQRALVALDRPRLAVLVVLSRASRPLTAAEVATQLAEQPATTAVTEEAVGRALDNVSHLLLAHPEGAGGFTVYDGVAAELQRWPELSLPSPDELLAEAPPALLVPVPDAERTASDRLSAERAFDAVSSVSELIAELTREGARELQKGGLALPASRRLAEALSVEPELVPLALSAAERAGLAGLDDGVWLPGERATSWQGSPTSDRWRELAAAWLEALPDDVRELLASRSRALWGSSLQEHLAWLYPGAVEEAQRRFADHTRLAEWLGITVSQGAAGQAPSSAGAALVEDGAPAAAEALAGLFPAEVDRVYLQNDLTIVSPGPLAPAVESRLRGMADLESRALASTFRLSSASLDRAITAGETEDTIRAFLTEISLTGVPQPIDYLVGDAAERHGRVRVREAGVTASRGVDYQLRPGARSEVHSSDATLLRTIEVDQALASLRLARAGAEVLLSRFPRDVVFWALSDARYPVLAEDENGVPITLRRDRVARPRTDRQADADAELVARLRETESTAADDPADQWLARQLDLAVRSRQPVIVEVAMPDGTVVDYLLEPTGLGGGRFRGRDRAADIERTLPLSSVRGVRAPE
ncbi:helicase-associated domain-containing protein [Leifsonia sp. AG29]|uniref:helicase-associated domain-containing protein n=1 Tax=Leifsonia sp. AG29 TaxID=2598860 RepID=UPI00131D2578|nr:helicase-associated domain-containing protein [Leifsonia sp. AG29]